jgi:REP element-mobilizing transposase RayT
VTFRLADSLPAAVLRRIVAERRRALETFRANGRQDSRAESKRIRRLFSRRIEACLDSGTGNCFLANPPVAKIVAQALRHFDGERYELFAWCVMPNHVHVVFRPLAGNSLAAIVHSWKSFSSQRANRLIGRIGVFWQREYYDHLIRGGEQFARAVRYVSENPARAGLRDWKWVEVYAER